MSSVELDITPDDNEEVVLRSIKDPIHGYIEVDPVVSAFIDTPQFQRLRYLKQLGTSYFVWPGASHNRFEHCLGVGWLARQMVKGLRERQPKLGITDRDVRCVELAGLCHDLGHGPFSHVFDGHFIPAALPRTQWQHEDASEMMLDALVSENEEIRSLISKDDLDFIKDLIAGVPNHTRHKSPPEKAFLFEIVANKKNGIDVDKFDYIARDTYAIGNKCNLSAVRLLQSARVIKGEICYNAKDVTTVSELFHERYALHKAIYTHKTAKAIELMVVDALLKAEPYMKIAERIFDPKKYLHLTDSILEEIERSSAPELEESRKLMLRLRKRQLYKLVYYQLPRWEDRDLWKEKLTVENIFEAAKAVCKEEDLTDEISASDIIVDWSKLHYGMKETNPVDLVKFYGKNNKNESYRVTCHEGSQLLPPRFQETMVRVYTRHPPYTWIIHKAILKLLPSLSSAPPTDEYPTTPRMTSPQLPEVSTPGVAKTGSSVSIAESRMTPVPSPNPFTTPRYAPKSPTGNNRRKRESAGSGMEAIEEEDGAPAKKIKVA